MSIRVLVADDHGIVREGLRTLLEKQSDIDVIGEAENGRTAVRMAQELLPDVIIMDITMPDLNGVEATRQAVAVAPNAKVIALSMHSDKRFVEGMLSAGARGYLLKDSLFEELAHAVRSVASGRAYLTPSIAGLVVEEYVDHVRRHTSARPPGVRGLSPREREVLQLLAEGRSAREAAARLGISHGTIDSHRRHIMQKLDIHSTAELTKYAIREGLTPLEDRPLSNRTYPA